MGLGVIAFLSLLRFSHWSSAYNHVIRTLKTPIAWIVTVAILFTLGPALTYPSGWDELTYHMELPRRWSTASQMSVFNDLPYSALPSLLEAIFTLTYPIEWLVTPRLIVWVLWVHGMAIFYEALKQLCAPATAAVLTLAMVASPMSLMISANCYVETLIWANVAGILWLGLKESPQPAHDWQRASLIGLLIGGAMAVKMTSVGILCLPLLLASTRQHFNYRHAAIALLMALGMAAPFYLRTWLQTGNPVSPFYASLFTSEPRPLQCSQYHHDLASTNFGMHGIPGLVVSPFALAIANEIYDGTLGCQWLGLLFLVVIASVRALQPSRPHRSVLVLAATASCLFYALWFLTSQQVRFAIPLIMVVMLAAAIGIESYTVKARSYWRIAIVGLTLISLPWSHAGYYLDSWLCVLKVRTPVDYIRDGVSDSYAELTIEMHERLPTDAKIISLFEHRLAYMPAGVEIATPYFQTKYFADPAAETPESFLAELHTHNIQYVVLTTNPLGPDISARHIESQQQWFRNVDACLANGQLKVVWKSEFHAIASVQ